MVYTCPFRSYTRTYLPIIAQVKFVTAVKFHYKELQLTAVFLTINQLYLEGNFYFAGDGTLLHYSETLIVSILNYIQRDIYEC